MSEKPVKIPGLSFDAKGTLTTIRVAVSPADRERILSARLSHASVGYEAAEGTAVNEVKNLTVDSVSLVAAGIGLLGHCDMKPATVTVAVEEVRALRARLAEIDAYPIENIVWTEGDNVLNIDPKVIADWKFIGLSNSHFPFYNHPLRRK